MAHGVAPVAVASAAADGVDLELVVAAGCEAAHGQGAGTGELMPDHILRPLPDLPPFVLEPRRGGRH